MRTRLTAYFFLIVMLAKVCVMPVIYLDYELRRDYIVKNLCVNKSRPQLNCDGKCYLAKRIAAAQEKEQHDAERQFLFQLCETLAEPSGPFTCLFSRHTPSTGNNAVSFSYASGLNGRMLITGIFHPPLEG